MFPNVTTRKTQFILHKEIHFEKEGFIPKIGRYSNGFFGVRKYEILLNHYHIRWTIACCNLINYRRKKQRVKQSNKYIPKDKLLFRTSFNGFLLHRWVEGTPVCLQPFSPKVFTIINRKCNDCCNGLFYNFKIYLHML